MVYPYPTVRVGSKDKRDGPKTMTNEGHLWFDSHFGATKLHQTITGSCIFSTGATGQALGDFS